MERSKNGKEQEREGVGSSAAARYSEISHAEAAAVASDVRVGAMFTHLLQALHAHLAPAPLQPHRCDHLYHLERHGATRASGSFRRGTQRERRACVTLARRVLARRGALHRNFCVCSVGPPRAL